MRTSSPSLTPPALTVNRPITRFLTVHDTRLQAFLYVACGTYGAVSELGYAKAFIVGLQLGMAGVMVIYLDELMQVSACQSKSTPERKQTRCVEGPGSLSTQNQHPNESRRTPFKARFRTQ